MEDRIKAAEEAISHLIEAQDAISDEVARQSTELAAISRRVAMLLEREARRQADEEGGAILTDQKPPHW